MKPIAGAAPARPRTGERPAKPAGGRKAKLARDVIGNRRFRFATGLGRHAGMRCSCPELNCEHDERQK